VKRHLGTCQIGKKQIPFMRRTEGHGRVVAWGPGCETAQVGLGGRGMRWDMAEPYSEIPRKPNLLVEVSEGGKVKWDFALVSPWFLTRGLYRQNYGKTLRPILETVEGRYLFQTVFMLVHQIGVTESSALQCLEAGGTLGGPILEAVAQALGKGDTTKLVWLVKCIAALHAQKEYERTSKLLKLLEDIVLEAEAQGRVPSKNEVLRRHKGKIECDMVGNFWNDLKAVGYDWLPANS